MSAASPVRLSTGDVEANQRFALMADVMGTRLAGGAIDRHGDRPVCCDWTLASVAPSTVIGHVVQMGFTARRAGRRLADDDADLSIFLGRSGAAPFEQNGRRVVLGKDDAVIVAHARAVQSWWTDSEATVLRIPRAAITGADRIEVAGGVRVRAGSPTLRLLNAYAQALWPAALAGNVPGVAQRHLAELAGSLLDEAIGAQTAGGPGVDAARLALMREEIARRYADPHLTMARVAAAIGLSERSGFLLFEEAGERFSEVLYEVRLDRAAERIRSGFARRLTDVALDAGFSDLSHFNRRFRRRFGQTPSEMRAEGRAGLPRP